MLFLLLVFYLFTVFLFLVFIFILIFFLILCSALSSVLAVFKVHYRGTLRGAEAGFSADELLLFLFTKVKTGE